MEPSEFLLMRNTHLQPITCWTCRAGISSQVPLRTNALNSSDIAVHQFESLRACETHDGSIERERVCLVAAWAYFGFGLKILFWDIVGIVVETGATGVIGKLDEACDKSVEEIIGEEDKEEGDECNTWGCDEEPTLEDSDWGKGMEEEDVNGVAARAEPLEGAKLVFGIMKWVGCNAIFGEENPWDEDITDLSVQWNVVYGNTVSSKTTCREIKTRLLFKLEHLYTL